MLCVIKKSDRFEVPFHFYFKVFVNVSFWRLSTGGFTLALCIKHVRFVRIWEIPKDKMSYCSSSFDLSDVSICTSLVLACLLKGNG